MSPFSHFLHELRLRHGIRQAELAELMGYEQSYISALEIGIKGPPPPEFVDKLMACLEMSSAEQEEVRQLVDASQRKLILEPDSPTDMFWLFKELRDQMRALHPIQIKMIRDALELKHSLADWQPEPVRRIRRRRNMEAAM